MLGMLQCFLLYVQPGFCAKAARSFARIMGKLSENSPAHILELGHSCMAWDCDDLLIGCEGRVCIFGHGVVVAESRFKYIRDW